MKTKALSTTWSLLLLAAVSLNAQAPTTSPAIFAKTIEPATLKQHLYELTSPQYEGRETGTEGQRKAALYLSGTLAKTGLSPVKGFENYQQAIQFHSQAWKNNKLSDKDKGLRQLWDYYSYPGLNGTNFQQNFKEAVFLGFGIEDPRYNDYKKANVKGKLVVVYDGEPVDADGRSWVTKGDSMSTWSTDYRRKIRSARANGAAALFIIDRNFKENVQTARRAIVNSRNSMAPDEQPDLNYCPNLFMNPELVKQAFNSEQIIKTRDKINKKGKPASSKLTCDLSWEFEKTKDQLNGSNVLGWIEGSDPQLKNEFLVITAHYDHLGKRGDDIYFGADDNASGTSTVLEIAQAFAEAKKAGAGPRRSVLIMLVSGEEKGLLGSQYYAQHPAIPLAQTIANLNIDMVGRVDKKHADNPNYIYVIGADRLSTQLHEINETANATYTKLELDYKYNEESDPNRYYYRSDHYNFAKNGIPVIFYFNGDHDDYHRTSDTPDKINYEKMSIIGQLVFHTAWELTNRDQRIVVDKKK